MSEKRVLKINPDLFSFSNNTTRKKRDNNPNGKIKVKSPSAHKREDTLKKKSILKMIRDHQEEKLKKMFVDDKKPEKSGGGNTAIKNDFQEAKEFLQNLTQKTEETTKRNTTLKNHSIMSNTSAPMVMPAISTTFSQSLPQPMSFIVPDASLPISPIQLNSSPNWGCLKGGALPTYRSYVNTTRKLQPQIGSGSVNTGAPVINSSPRHFENKPQNAFSTIPSNYGGTVSTGEANMNAKLDKSLSRIEQITQTKTQLQNLNGRARPKKMKRRKTLRRTYKIGKSKVFPRVSVLVSNRTIRNNITTKTQNLKQVPIQDVKSFLIKRGFIKVGSMAPNDVLRKMYESASLICGDVQNHNSENLLYNYINH